jgi:hypothetical protein
MARCGQLAAEGHNSPAGSLPARHPRLRDTAIVFAVLSTICYFAFSEGVRGFAGIVVKIFARIGLVAQ